MVFNEPFSPSVAQRLERQERGERKERENFTNYLGMHNLLNTGATVVQVPEREAFLA